MIVCGECEKNIGCLSYLNFKIIFTNIRGKNLLLPILWIVGKISRNCYSFLTQVRTYLEQFSLRGSFTLSQGHSSHSLPDLPRT